MPVHTVHMPTESSSEYMLMKTKKLIKAFLMNLETAMLVWSDSDCMAMLIFEVLCSDLEYEFCCVEHRNKVYPQLIWAN